jgi:hypothetical protein
MFLLSIIYPTMVHNSHSAGQMCVCMQSYLWETIFYISRPSRHQSYILFTSYIYLFTEYVFILVVYSIISCAVAGRILSISGPCWCFVATRARVPILAAVRKDYNPFLLLQSHIYVYIILSRWTVNTILSLVSCIYPITYIYIYSYSFGCAINKVLDMVCVWIVDEYLILLIVRSELYIYDIII